MFNKISHLADAVVKYSHRHVYNKPPVASFAIRIHWIFANKLSDCFNPWGTQLEHIIEWQVNLVKPKEVSFNWSSPHPIIRKEIESEAVKWLILRWLYVCMFHSSFSLRTFLTIYMRMSIKNTPISVFAFFSTSKSHLCQFLDDWYFKLKGSIINKHNTNEEI